MNFPIHPCFWFDSQAREAALFYQEAFPEVKILNESPLVVNLRVADQSLMFLNGGPVFTINPSISLFYHCRDEAEIEALWNRLSEGGNVLMPLGSYPFARRYVWVADRYGINWQLILPLAPGRKTVVPSLMFTQDRCGRAEEALGFYTSLFPGSEVGTLSRYPAGSDPDREGTLNYAEFSLGGQWFTAMDSAQPHPFTFTEGASLFLEVETQEQIDHFWARLTEGGEESQCGWLKDRFGVSWQVVPRILGELMADPARAERVIQAFLPMKKLDIETLKRA